MNFHLEIYKRREIAVAMTVTQLEGDNLFLPKCLLYGSRSSFLQLSLQLICDVICKVFLIFLGTAILVTIVDRTCGIPKNLYFYPFIRTIFGPIN